MYYYYYLQFTWYIGRCSAVVRKRFWEPPRKCRLYIEVGIVNNRVMLWAGTPGAELGPRHIDWGPGGCARARRSLLYGHSLNVGWAATTAAANAAAAAAATVVAVVSPRIDEAHPTTSRNQRIRFEKMFSVVSNKSDEKLKSPRTSSERRGDGIAYLTI